LGTFLWPSFVLRAKADLGRKGGKKMKSISTLVAALLLTGILGLSATSVMADFNEDISTSVYPLGSDEE